DGKPDFVLQGGAGFQQTGIWYMNNNVFVSGKFGPTLPAGWFLRILFGVAGAGVGDFNGDGHPDFVLQGGAGGQQTAIWYLNNNNFLFGLFGPTLPVGWFVVGTGDFNGDGHPDFVLQGGTGFQQTAIWYLNNNVFVSGKFGPTLPVGWFVVGVGDFNGDGHPAFALPGGGGFQQHGCLQM